MEHSHFLDSLQKLEALSYYLMFLVSCFIKNWSSKWWL